MTSDEMLPELQRYREFESGLPLSDSSEFRSLVVFGSNDAKPIHRWFRFKEAYSADLLGALLDRYRVGLGPDTHLLDPFCGSGTTLLSAQCVSHRHVRATGIERNPFIHFVAKTKLRWHELDPSRLAGLSQEILRSVDLYRGSLPDLSSIKSGRCVSPHIARRILAIRDRILQVASPYQEVLLLGLAACIETLSKVRKDGRALRLVERPRSRVVAVVHQKWREMLDDISRSHQLLSRIQPATVCLGDGRVPQSIGIERDSLDLIVTSPPYPNNIDYSEVYKLELWMLGFVTAAEEFLHLRKSTFRSHPTSDLTHLSAAFEAELERGALKTYFEPLIQRTEKCEESWRRRLIVGYFQDLWHSLNNQYICLKPGGRAFIVVGNSLHGGDKQSYLVPTDILTAAIGQVIGFQVEHLHVARSMKRRLAGNHFLRESIVVLRRPPHAS